MSEKPTIVAVNGSPHAGIVNTFMMIEMLRTPLSREGFDLEIIKHYAATGDLLINCH